MYFPIYERFPVLQINPLRRDKITMREIMDLNKNKSKKTLTYAPRLGIIQSKNKKGKDIKNQIYKRNIDKEIHQIV